jgi:hypothetical protein
MGNLGKINDYNEFMQKNEMAGWANKAYRTTMATG